jgi:anaerobic magnesium-protoporphyrin IX monomethyl ester cyclase
MYLYPERVFGSDGLADFFEVSNFRQNLMAKILFIQREASEKFGVMSLSAALKKAGHETEMFIELLGKETIFDFFDRWQPDWVAFSVTTMEKEWAVKMAGNIKRKRAVKTVFGGAEATYNPEGLIQNAGVDFLCRGEGERALPELLGRVEEGKTVRGIGGIWGKEYGRVVKNKLGRLIENLDGLPLPDREIYYKYPLLRNLRTKKFLAGRGCPYSCTYCSNHAYLKLFEGLGNYIRFRSPKSVVEEIIQVREKYGMKTVYFADETFTLNHQWLGDFLPLYKKKVGLPFSCLARANELDELTVRRLKQSGCFYVAFGLETGSDRIRNEVLKRNMSREQLLKAAGLLRKYRIPFLTHQMYVLPTETIDEAWETVKLNIKMGTDTVWDTVFQPFSNTEIFNYCREHQLLPKRLEVDSMFGQSHIKNQDKKLIENVRRLAWISIKIPWLLPLFKRLVYLPNNVVFEFTLKASEIYSLKRRYRLSFGEMFYLAAGTGNKLG